MKKILYLDMDGVLCDFDSEIKKVHPTIFEHEDHEDHDYRGKVIDEIVEADPRLFLRLELIPGAFEAVTKLQLDFEVYFLSTPMWNVPHSFMDKRLWIEKHFGDSAKKRLILSHRKDLNIGHYLIDDRLKNGAAEFIGEHIHFGTPKFPNWSSVIEYIYFSKL
jgi:5'-nucleotidase